MYSIVEWGMEDLHRMMKMKTISGIVLPKVESDSDVESVSKIIKSGIGSHIPLWAMIETPKGLLNAASIAQHPQLDCLVFGSNDFTKEIRGKHTPQREPLLYAMSHCIVAARAAKKFVLDGVHSNFQDTEGFKFTCAQGRSLGFDGKTLIHPSQIELANEMYSPSPEEIEFALKVVLAWRAAVSSGVGIVTVEGKMIELLHYEEALDVLRFAQTAGIPFAQNDAAAAADIFPN
jgi:citrate lyase beta subunit